MKLEDLKPGDEFEYADSTQYYHKGLFIVLDDTGYLRPDATKHARFLYSHVAKKVVNHWVELNVIIKKEANVKSRNQMGHFVGWRFGVPVKISTQAQTERDGAFVNARLVYEDSTHFVVIGENGMPAVCGKLDHYYELIPHRYGRNKNGPRYPICETSEYTSFCNSGNRMTTLDNYGGKMELYPAAKLVLEDGTEIELSAETTESLKQQLGR